MCFPLPLILEKLEGRTFRLEKPFCYDGHGIQLCVPAGSTTDFASIPSPLHWILPPFGRYDRAAVVHDYMYRTACRSRVVADAIFLEGMQLCGVPRWQRCIIYKCVRWFGGKSYGSGLK